MKRLAVSATVLLLVLSLAAQTARPDSPAIAGFRDPTAQLDLERRFMSVPDRALAREHLRVLTAAPHMAGTPEDRATAEYVAAKFRQAGLDTEIRPYRVWMNTPVEVSIEAFVPGGMRMRVAAREHVDGDAFQDDPRVVPPFNAYAPSGDAEADVVYANYGRPEDIRRLRDLGVDLRGKILLVRYGESFRGVKSYVAQQNGAAGVLLYSDPIDDGAYRGDTYPAGPWRPLTSVQRGSIQYGLRAAGDPTTPGFASTQDLPDSRRIPPEDNLDTPRVPTAPISAADALPILQSLAGPETPREWQGALPLTYRAGPGPVRVRLHLKQDYRYTLIWNVIGAIRGARWPEQVVVAGNHRDAWVYGAVDPGSGTAAMLETVHGLGELLRQGWRPARTIVFASWDAEEQGLIGSTEWAEQNATLLRSAVAYFNMDMGAAGPHFCASGSGSLKQFVRDLARSVPSPKGGSVYDSWLGWEREPGAPRGRSLAARLARRHAIAPVDDLGSGSDFTAFLHHLGVPSTDVRSTGSYGVYHSVFDNFAWYTRFADPSFAYTQQMARLFGLEVLRMAEADVLPYDYEQYGREIAGAVAMLRARADQAWAGSDLTAPLAAAQRLASAGARIARLQQEPPEEPLAVNRALLAAERALLLRNGLPGRPWFRHAIYAPAQFSGYAAVVLPGLSDAIDQRDRELLREQVAALAAALNRASELLERATTPVTRVAAAR